MSVHGIRVSPYNLPSAAQYEDLVNSLRALLETVDDTGVVPQRNIDAIERFEARFFRSAHPVKEKLTSFLAKIDADYCARRPNIYHRSGFDADELQRDVNGEVVHLTDYTHVQQIASLHPLLLTRMLILTNLNLACVLWFLAGWVSYFDVYQTHIKFTLIGLCLSLNKQALGTAIKRTLLTILSLAFAPCKTVKGIYRDEITLRRGAAREAKCLCGYTFARAYVDCGPTLYVGLCAMAIVQLISVFYSDLETGSQWLALPACLLLLRPVVRKLV